MKYKLTKSVYEVEIARKISQARKIVKTFTNFTNLMLLTQKIELLRQKR